MKDCMIIRGAVEGEDGREETFRPSTRSPGMHWAYMLMDQYRHRVNMAVKWVDNEPVITITPLAVGEDEIAFKHIMEFTKMHGLDVTVCEDMCNKCEGHASCLTPYKKS